MREQNFIDFLDKKGCFKLILGASNKDINAIENICRVFYREGCRFFDVTASIDIIKMLKKNFPDCFICVSLGSKQDTHLKKYKINSALCTGCKLCYEVCKENALENKERCTGCARCKNACPNGAIEEYSVYQPMSEILPSIIQEGIDCIEYHGEDLREYKELCSLYKGPLSVSINRKNLGDDDVISLLWQMKESHSGLFMVQADGNPISGGCDDYRTTLQALAMAELIEKTGITPYIFISGGTNSKTHELIKLFNLDIAGISMGSFARQNPKRAYELIHYLKLD